MKKDNENVSQSENKFVWELKEGRSWGDIKNTLYLALSRLEEVSERNLNLKKETFKMPVNPSPEILERFVSLLDTALDATENKKDKEILQSIKNVYFFCKVIAPKGPVSRFISINKTIHVWSLKEEQEWSEIREAIVILLEQSKNLEASKIASKVPDQNSSPEHIEKFLEELQTLYLGTQDDELKEALLQFKNNYFQEKIMPNLSCELIEEKVNTLEFPQLDEKHPPQKQNKIIIGDLHASAIKLLFMLIKQGVFKNVAEKDYRVLVDIFLKPSLNREDLEQFKSILSSIETDDAQTIIFIGDEVADRGTNDYFILKILEKLHIKGVSFEILLSNHGMEFIKAFEDEQNLSLEEKNPFQICAEIGDEYIFSLLGLKKLINDDEKLIKKSEILDIVKNVYKKALKVIICTQDLKAQEITLITHAPSPPFPTIQALAKKLGVNFTEDDYTIIKLPHVIETINQVFQDEYVDKNKVNKLESKTFRNSKSFTIEQDLKDNPIGYITWNRNYKDLENQSFILFDHSRIKTIFGHDLMSSLYFKDTPEIFGLDNELNKYDSTMQNDPDESWKGLYKIILSAEKFFLEKQKSFFIIENEKNRNSTEFFEHQNLSNRQLIQIKNDDSSDYTEYTI